MTETELIIFLLKALAAAMWFYSGVLAWYVKRWRVAVGFPGAGLNSLYAAYVFSSSPHVGDLLSFVSSVASPLIAALICTSFMHHQVRGRRPSHWTP